MSPEQLTFHKGMSPDGVERIPSLRKLERLTPSDTECGPQLFSSSQISTQFKEITVICSNIYHSLTVTCLTFSKTRKREQDLDSGTHMRAQARDNPKVIQDNPT